MAKLVDGRASENIFFNIYSGTLSQLPDIYKNNITKIEKYKDKLYPELLEGKYTRLESTDQLGNVTGIDLNGFVITRLLANGETTVSGKVEKTYTIADIFIQDREARIQAVDSEGNALNGAYFKFANTSTSQVGEPVVAINFDDKGKEIFCRLSEANIGKPMAIFIGGQLLTSPTIQSKICGGSAQIDGSFTSDSARELSTSLND
jgi:preprotein translocase subunit SecD